MAHGLRRAGRLIVLGSVVSAFLAPLPASASPAPHGPARTVAVLLPADVTLPPGTYDVVIRGKGTQLTTRVTVDAQPLAPAGPPTDSGRVALLLVVVGLVLLVALGMTVMALRRRRSAGTGSPFLFRAGLEGRRGTDRLPETDQPRQIDQSRLIDRYRRLVALIAAEQYKQALPELTRLEGTLPAGLRPEARFYIAFALYQLGYLDEAEHRLAALRREDPPNADVAYLLAYLRVQRRDFDGARPVLAAMAADRQLTGRARKLYGIVQYERALAALRDGDIDAAAKLFETVGRLGDLRDQVPADLRNRHVVVGTRALVDKDVTAARTEFESLAAAGRLDPARRDDLLVLSKLGLALAAWIEDAPGASAQIEQLLVAAIRLLDPTAPLTTGWRAIDPHAGLVEELQALDEEKPEEHRDRDRAIRDMHFLRGVAVLRAWSANPARADAKGYFGDALARFACARAIDPTFADAYLVVGLLLFHLSGVGNREQSIASLREARKRGVRNPELIQILNRHDRRPPSDQSGTDELLDLIDVYLRDPTVQASVRAELRRRRARFGKARDWDNRPDATDVRAVQPTVAELSERADLLAARIRLLGGKRVDGDPGDAERAAADLAQASQLLAEQARAVEQCEAALLALIGDTMLAESGR